MQWAIGGLDRRVSALAPTGAGIPWVRGGQIITSADGA